MKRTLNIKIYSIHERALRITYSDRISTFQELTAKDTICIQYKNLQVPATETFKTKNDMDPEI